MARKTSTKTVKIELPTTGGDERDTNAASDDDIEQALAQLPEGTIAKIYRQVDGREHFVKAMAPNAASEELISTFGPGTYIVRMFGPTGDGNRKGYKGQRQVFIAALPEGTAPVPAAAPSSSGGGLMDQMASGMLLGMLQQMQQMNAMQATMSREHSAAMMALLGKIGEKSPTDPLLATLLTEVLSKRVDPIEQATKIAEITSKNGGGGGSRDIIAALELADRIRERSGDDGGGKSDKGWVGIFRELAPLVFKQGEPSAAAQPQLAAGSPPNEVPTDTSLTYLDPLVPFLPQIAQSAEVGTDAAKAADYYISFVPPGHYPILAGILDRPSVVVDIVRRAPALAPFDAWLTVLVREMRAAIAPDDGDGDGGGDDGG